MTQFGGKSIGESEWKPHNWNIETNPSVITCTPRVSGPDWTSRLRCLPHESVDDVTVRRNINKMTTGRRHFPWIYEQSAEEWSYYFDGSAYGKRYVIDGTFKGNTQTVDEVQLEKVMGCHGKVQDSRGGLFLSSPGDKSYSVPEYSADFHKEGSTLPAINFSRANELIADTFIPLQPLSRSPSIAYKEKEAFRKLAEEEKEVLKLNDWTPAPPITAAI